MICPAPRVSVSILLIFGMIACSQRNASAQNPSTTETLTNGSVVQMVMGKVPKDLILTKIRFTRSAFDVTASGLVTLHQSKVENDLVKEMIKAAGTQGSSSTESLTNEAVMSMVAGDLPRDLILLKIQSTKPAFDLTATGLVSLNQNKVRQDVVKAMMSAAATPAMSVSSPAAEVKTGPALVPPPGAGSAVAGIGTGTPAPGLGTTVPPNASGIRQASSPITEKDFEKVFVTRNPDDVKGMTRVGDVSASAKRIFGGQASLREAT
jgi:hypothetical protein